MSPVFAVIRGDVCREPRLNAGVDLLICQRGRKPRGRNDVDEVGQIEFVEITPTVDDVEGEPFTIPEE